MFAWLFGAGADARMEGVNKPELLPKEFSTVIDIAGFLTDGEVRHLPPQQLLCHRSTSLIVLDSDQRSWLPRVRRGVPPATSASM